MMVSKDKIIIVVLVAAALLRLYRLGDFPALNADEASIGYNAYSLIQTGKDEHSNPWPLHFQSFNDYKPGGYFYIALPFVYFFGLSEWSVRLPGAVFGIITVYVVYLLAREISPKNWKFAVLAAALLAISPWHIHFSRGAWEVNVATFFVTVGVLFYLRALRKFDYFVLCVLSFVAALYTYHAARIVVPVLGLAFLGIFRKPILVKSNIKLLLSSLMFGFILLLPLAYDLMGEAGQARASGVSLLADRGYIDRIAERRGHHEIPNTLLNRMLYNKPKELLVEFGKNYSEHFWGNFLFIAGDDIQRNKVPEFGQLYLFQLPLLIVAAYRLIRARRKVWLVVLVWLAIAPIPAALTFQSPHALRAQSMVIPLTILSAYGLAVMLNYLYKKLGWHTLAGLCVAFCILVSWEIARYVHEYWVHMAKTYPYSSQYGLKELTEYVRENENKYDRILVTTRYDQPYILFLFYGAIRGDEEFMPGRFQSNHELGARDKYGFSTVSNYGKYNFMPVDFRVEEDTGRGGLIVGSDEEIPDETNIIKNVYGTNGYLYFQVVAN